MPLDNSHWFVKSFLRLYNTFFCCRLLSPCYKKVKAFICLLNFDSKEYETSVKWSVYNSASLFSHRDCKISKKRQLFLRVTFGRWELRIWRHCWVTLIMVIRRFSVRRNRFRGKNCGQHIISCKWKSFVDLTTKRSLNHHISKVRKSLMTNWLIGP